jgi:hypothetical protein
MVATLVTAILLAISFLKTDVNVPSVGNEQKKVEKTYFFVVFSKATYKKDRIRIRYLRIQGSGSV